MNGRGNEGVGRAHAKGGKVEDRRECARGQEGDCERGRGVETNKGVVRLHRRLGAAPKAICISHHVF